MDTYCVKPIFQTRIPFNEVIEVPGSKSITNRALMLAALASGDTILEGVLFSDDSRHFLQCLQDLGFGLSVDEPARRVRVTGQGGRIPRQEASIYVGSAGTCARFLTAMLGCSKGTYHLDASPQMRRRPMAPLIRTLRQLGCEILCKEQEGFFPFTLIGRGITAAEATVNIEDSSQFLSALLMAAVMLDHDFTIRITGSHGLSYIQMTVKMMQQFGAGVISPDERCYQIAGSSRYQAARYQIEPDMSGAAYFYAMGAISGGSILVKHIHSDSLQGDIRILELFQRMGCTVCETEEGIRLTGPKDALKGVTADMSSFSDQALTLAAMAPFAEGPTRICGIGHIRLQECDRIHAILRNLSTMGVSCTSTGDEILITPAPSEDGTCKLLPAEIETYDDHRVAMAFALCGLKVPGITIQDPMCCRKTFENYFELLDEICSRYDGEPSGHR